MRIQINTKTAKKRMAGARKNIRINNNFHRGNWGFGSGVS